MTEAEAQAALAEIALQLVAIEDRLQGIHDALPRPPNQDTMWEHRVPRDVATEVYGTIEHVVGDLLGPMIEQLERAAGVTAEELGERFRARG